MTRFRLDLTPHERAALLSALADYMTRIGVSIDASSGEELEIGALLKRVMDAPPIDDDERKAFEKLQQLRAREGS